MGEPSSRYLPFSIEIDKLVIPKEPDVLSDNELRADIEHLGNINNDAPEEFTAINERYEFLKKQIEELKKNK